MIANAISSTEFMLAEQGGILPIEVGCHICGDIVNEMQQHRNDDVARLEIDDRKGKSDGP